MSDEYLRAIATSHGADVNQLGSVYTRGEAYDYNKKLTVAAAYLAAKDANNGSRPNISALEREYRVGRTFIKKIELELFLHNRVLRPSEIQQNRPGPVGAGSRSLDEIDAAVILFLYFDEPSRCLRDYTDSLQLLTGTIVSGSTISRFFNHAFPFKAGLCRANKVPLDKFKPANIERAIEYIEVIAAISPWKIKFGDCFLKGDAIFNRKNRRNPFTGEVPEMVVTSDFRNRYNLTGFCSINPRTTARHGSAVWCSLHEATNDADQFALELEYAIFSGFFEGGDVLVLDNAQVHCGDSNTVLEEYMWDQYGIFVLFLPARAPEWNPQEQVWKLLVQKLSKLDLRACLEFGQHATAHAAIEILSNVTYDEVYQFYIHADVIRR